MTHYRLVSDCSNYEAEAVLRLWRQAEATVSITDTVDDILRAANASMAFLLIAEQDGKVVGSVIGGFDGWRGNVYRLAVHPNYRRRGIARRLVTELESHLVELGAKRITSLVENEHYWATSFWTALDYDYDPGMARYVHNL